MDSLSAIFQLEQMDQHRCALLQNRYMVVYHGRDWDARNDMCNPHHGLRLFDLQRLEWTTSYEFTNNQEPYKVPRPVYEVVGGEYVVLFHSLLGAA